MAGREICGAMEKSDDYVAVGMLVDAINACIEWADAARVAKEALAARVAAEEEAKKQRKKVKEEMKVEKNNCF